MERAHEYYVSLITIYCTVGVTLYVKQPIPSKMIYYMHVMFARLASAIVVEKNGLFAYDESPCMYSIIV